MQDTKAIKEHMEVLAADGKHVGTVDHLEGGNSIKLTKSDPSSGGKHHLIPVAWGCKPLARWVEPPGPATPCRSVAP